jgi:hypothetical protein
LRLSFNAAVIWEQIAAAETDRFDPCGRRRSDFFGENELLFHSSKEGLRNRILPLFLGKNDEISLVLWSFV